MAKKTFIACEPIRHDGESFAPGKPISLEAELGAQYKAAGLVRDVAAGDKVQKAPAASETDSPENQ